MQRVESSLALFSEAEKLSNDPVDVAASHAPANKPALTSDDAAPPESSFKIELQVCEKLCLRPFVSREVAPDGLLTSGSGALSSSYEKSLEIRNGQRRIQGVLMAILQGRAREVKKRDNILVIRWYSTTSSRVANILGNTNTESMCVCTVSIFSRV